MSIYETKLIPYLNESDENKSLNKSLNNNNLSISAIQKPPLKSRRIIFQTWKDKEIPKKWAPSVLSIFNKLPGWEYRLFTDEDNDNLVKEYFPHFYNKYQKFPYVIQRVDAMRYCVLAKANEIFDASEKGPIEVVVYMDLDLVINRCLDDLFDYHKADLYFTPSGNINLTVTNSFMAARPNQKIFLDCINHMLNYSSAINWWHIGKHLNVMHSTGPLMVQKMLGEHKYPHLNLPAKAFMPCNLCDLNCMITEEDYLRPLEGSSWCGGDSKIYSWMMCNWKLVLMIIVILIVLIIVLCMVFGVSYKRKREEGKKLK